MKQRNCYVQNCNKKGEKIPFIETKPFEIWFCKTHREDWKKHFLDANKQKKTIIA